MGRNPKESPKAHSHAHANDGSLENRHCKEPNSHARAQIYEILSIDGPPMSRTFSADLRIPRSLYDQQE